MWRGRPRGRPPRSCRRRAACQRLGRPAGRRPRWRGAVPRRTKRRTGGGARRSRATRAGKRRLAVAVDRLAAGSVADLGEVAVQFQFVVAAGATMETFCVMRGKRGTSLSRRPRAWSAGFGSARATRSRRRLENSQTVASRRANASGVASDIVSRPRQSPPRPRKARMPLPAETSAPVSAAMRRAVASHEAARSRANMGFRRCRNRKAGSREQSEE